MKKFFNAFSTTHLHYTFPANNEVTNRSVPYIYIFTDLIFIYYRIKINKFWVAVLLVFVVTSVS